MASMQRVSEVIALNTKRLRAEKNWSQTELAERAKVSGRTITRLENGSHRRLDQETLMKVAEAFGVSVVELQTPPGMSTRAVSEDGATFNWKKPKAAPIKDFSDLVKTAMDVVKNSPRNDDEMFVLQTMRSLSRKERDLLLAFVDTGSKHFEKNSHSDEAWVLVRLFLSRIAGRKPRPSR